MRLRARGGALAALCIGLVARSAAAADGVATRPVLGIEKARAVIAAARGAAERGGAGGAIAVVDDGGHLLALERLDGTFPAAAPVAEEKARSAATFRRATREFESAVKNGRVALVANRALLPMQGGVPLLLDGQVVGAIGVAGAASADADDEIARAAAATLAGGEGAR